MSPDPFLVDRLNQHGQSHLLRWWGELNEEERGRLAAEIASIDFEQLDRLIADLVRARSGGGPGRPTESSRSRWFDCPRPTASAWCGAGRAGSGPTRWPRARWASSWSPAARARVWAIEGPKGTFPIGPVSSASLFQIHAEKIVALGRRYGRTIPLYVMTSPENHEATIAFFESARPVRPRARPVLRSGSDAGRRSRDRQGSAGVEGPRRTLARRPRRHAGRAGRARAGRRCPVAWTRCAAQGVRTLFYFQVDNPLVRIAEPSFIGLHREADAEMSFKVVERLTPEEKLGVVVMVDGRPQVIEYSDLPPELAERRVPEGTLELWAGSIAVHILERSFIERLAGEHRLPFHRALKKVAHVDDRGQIVQPAEPNAVKFEQFIFDALPLAERWTMVETDRAGEFEPLKNAVGPDSPATVHQRMSDQFGNWLEQAGAVVPRRPDGSVPFGIEISPLFALDATELKSKIEPGMVIERPIYLR